MDLAKRWEQTWSQLSAEPPVGLCDELLLAYTEPHRAYHTIQHLSECFEWLDLCTVRPLDPPVLELALWFHDAIYDTRASDNERASAAWARRALCQLEPSLLDSLEALIILTEHLVPPNTPDQCFLLDLDLSILGASEDRYAEYEAQVRAEYHWVPVERYTAARIRVLQSFQNRSTLFQTEYFRSRLEEQAHLNLARSIASLRHLTQHTRDGNPSP